MDELKNNIRVVTFLSPEVLDEDNSPIASAIIDTYETTNGPSFDTALITAQVGEYGADVTDVEIKIEESDDSTFGDASETIANGGEEVSVDEETAVAFQILRTKRYLRATVTITAGGAGDTVPVAITGILCKWAKPFPIV